MKQINLLIDPADCCLDAGVCRPYLVAIYAELSHGQSLMSRLKQVMPMREECGKLGNREGYAEGSASANGLVGNDRSFVALNDCAHD